MKTTKHHFNLTFDCVTREKMVDKCVQSWISNEKNCYFKLSLYFDTVLNTK